MTRCQSSLWRKPFISAAEDQIFLSTCTLPCRFLGCNFVRVWWPSDGVESEHTAWQDLEKLPARASLCVKASSWVLVRACPVWEFAVKRVCLARPSIVQDAQSHSRSPFKRQLQRVWIVLKSCKRRRVDSDQVKCRRVSRARIESWKISGRTKTFFTQFENFVQSFPTASAEVKVKSRSWKSFPASSLTPRNYKPASQLWKELLSSAMIMIQWLKMLLSDAAEVPCAGPWDCGWGTGPEATTGDEPSGAVWSCPINLLEETDKVAARGWFMGSALSTFASWGTL